MDTVPFESLLTWKQLFASMLQHVCWQVFLPQSLKEEKVICNMTCPSIIFCMSDWGRIFLKKWEIYFYITWKLWVAITQDVKKSNENYHNWNILVNAAFAERFWYGKNICGCFLGKQNIHRTQGICKPSLQIQNLLFLRIFNHKTYLRYI